MIEKQLTLPAVMIAILFMITGDIACLEKRVTSGELLDDADSMTERASEAFDYAKLHKMNGNYVLLVDYSIPSGTPRLFVWSHDENKIVARTYVMHGPGEGSTAEHPVFSNRVGSKCSSLGKFKVTKLHGSKIKRSFRLQGLDRNNSNAFRRGIMIHRSTWVDRYCSKDYIPLHEQSCQGCITVSSKGMGYLERLIETESKPLLLWSYN